MWYHIGVLTIPHKPQSDKENDKMTKVTKQARFGGGRKLAVLLAVVATSAALPLHAATTWTCYPEITNGMTGPEQITNALTQLASGDTILVKPGTYDFTGISMRTDNFTKDGVTYVITNHLTRNINFTLKGDTSGHWDDSVVFTGNGRFCDLKDNWKYCYFNKSRSTASTANVTRAGDPTKVVAVR